MNCKTKKNHRKFHFSAAIENYADKLFDVERRGFKPPQIPAFKYITCFSADQRLLKPKILNGIF